MKTIAIKKSDGGVSIMTIKDNADVQSVLNKWAMHPRNDMVSYREISPDSLPDEVYRESWKDTGLTIKHDLPKARNLHMQEIRKIRDKELEKLDVEYMKAIESGDGLLQDSIAADKQALRDLPQTFDLSGAMSINQLLELWPEGLPKE